MSIKINLVISCLFKYYEICLKSNNSTKKNIFFVINDAFSKCLFDNLKIYVFKLKSLLNYLQTKIQEFLKVCKTTLINHNLYFLTFMYILMYILRMVTTTLLDVKF